MANKRKLFNPRIVVGVIAVILIILIPLPAAALYILIALNPVLAILIFLIALFSKKITDFSRYPTFLLISTIFGLAVNVFSARFILFKVDDRLIQAVASLAAGSGITRLIIGYAGSIAFASFLIIVITKCINRVQVAAARFVLEGMQVKMMAVEIEYGSGSITEEEAIIRKNAVQREGDFYNAMYETGEFISGSIKIAIFIMAVTILGGIGFSVLPRGESFADAVNTYIPLSILNGLQFLFSILLLSIAARRSVGRSALGN
jgi:flagellar biosynthesis protein FlhA